MEIHEYSRDGWDSYWAAGRSMETVELSVENSLCFGLYDPEGCQAGSARVITDYATFGWLCDVFVMDEHKGKGLGKWLVQTVVAFPELQGVKRLQLATKDAHELYKRYAGFAPLAASGLWMERVQEKK